MTKTNYYNYDHNFNHVNLSLAETSSSDTVQKLRTLWINGLISEKEYQEVVNKLIVIIKISIISFNPYICLIFQIKF